MVSTPEIKATFAFITKITAFTAPYTGHCDNVLVQMTLGFEQAKRLIGNNRTDCQRIKHLVASDILHFLEWNQVRN